MKHHIRTTSAATACGVALCAVPAQAQTIERDSAERVVAEKACEWEVDEDDKPIYGADGKPKKWADDTRDELGIGVVGVVGALLALILGAGMLFIENVNIIPLPQVR